MLLEHVLDGLQVEFLGQIHHREILVIEFAVTVRTVAIAGHHVLEEVPVGVHMALEIHVDEAGQLQEARIDPAHGARIHRRHGLDQIIPEPLIGAFLGQLVRHGRRFARIDGRPHESHGGGACGILVLSHQGDGGQGRRAGLTHRDHVRVRAQRRDHLAHIEHIVIKIETALGDRNLARIHPVGDVHFMVRQEGFDRAAQQRGVVTGHRGHDQHRPILDLRHLHAARFRERLAIPFEVQKRAEGLAPHGLDIDIDRLVIDVGRAQLPVGLAVIARQALEQVGGRGRGATRQRVRGRIERGAQRSPGHVRGGAPGQHGGPAHFQKRVKHSLSPQRRDVRSTVSSIRLCRISL